MTKELSIGIATCGRPRVLRRCLKSIKRFTNIPYKLIILDNTKAFTDKIDMSWAKRLADTYIEIEDRKIGCSESNNLIAESCDTEYLMHLDDDIYLVNDVVTEEYNFLENNPEIDIVSVMWKDTYYNGFREAMVKHVIGYTKYGKSFWKLSIPISSLINFDWVYSDEALHSMMLRTEIYKKVSWDNNFQWKGDREDFFLSCKKKNIRVANMLRDYVVHDPKPYPFGSMSFEFDSDRTKKYFKEKWNMYPLFAYAPVKRPGIDI